MNDDIFISRIHFPVTTLGPGHRIGIWFQGCSIRCPGCISTDTWAERHGATTVEAVIETVSEWFPSAEGITISGGEPFDQPKALLSLLNALRDKTASDILVFTGHSFEQVEPIITANESLIDALITDPFILAAPQTLALRGSDNQRLHLVTPLGKARFASYERLASKEDRRFDVMMDGSGTVWFAGIPGRDDFYKLQSVLEGAGHSVSTSEDVGHQRNRTR